MEECDFMLHGSGPSLVAEKDVVRWMQTAHKPFGVYGITLPQVGSASTTATPSEVLAKTIDVLNQAEFAFFRDSLSLAFAKELGCSCPIMEFGPDGAFGTDLRDHEKADAF